MARADEIRKVISEKGGARFRRLGVGATRLAQFIDYIAKDLGPVLKASPKPKAKAPAKAPASPDA